MNNRLGIFRSAVDKAKSERNFTQRTVDWETEQLRLAKQQFIVASKAQEVLQTVAKEVQIHAHSQIASIVNRCLKAVFGPNGVEFDIFFERKRGKTEAQIRFRKGDVPVKPLSSSAGGEIDIASFALRVVMLLLSRPAQRKLLVIDEGFRNVNGAEFRKRTAELVKTLSEELDIQFIFVTGHSWLEVGNIIRLGEST